MAAPADNLPLLGRRILVVDDDELFRTLVLRTLETLGAHAQAAADGRDGLHTLMGADFDLLVVDLRMKEMDGLGFLREARQIWPWIGAVVLTGYATPEACHQLAAVGVSRVLEKPLDTAVLSHAAVAEIEAAARRAATDAGSERLRQQLRILRLMTEPALKVQTLPQALRGLVAGLAAVVPAAIVGVLGIEDGVPALILHVRESVSPAFAAAVRQLVADRYQALSGRRLPEPLPYESQGIECRPEGVATVGSTFCIPIILGREIRGLVVLAATRPDSFPPGESAFVYHVANHLSTVLLALDRMRALAIHDPVTGLLNRTFLEQEARRLWLRSRRYRHPMVAILIDIDHFKAVNDSYGHPVGDGVLRELGDLLRATARESDIVGRYGGEEFLVILPNGEHADGAGCAERILNRVRRHVFCPRTHDLHLTISLGVAVAHPDDPENIGEARLLALADSAMYEAKRAGRDCWRASRPLPTEATDEPPTPPNPASARAGQRPQGRVLVADDEPAVRALLTAALTRGGYEVTAVDNGAQALDKAAQTPYAYDVVLADLQMPGIDGIELLRRVRTIDDTIIRIIVSGHATVDNAIASLRYGAFDFVQKPLSTDQLSLVMKRALEYRRALLENRQYQRHLSDMVREKSARLRESLDHIRASYDFTLEALVGLLDARERDVGQHSKRVRALALALAQRLPGMDADSLRDIGHGALLHDIGKIGVPDSILLKNGALLPADWEVMRRHPEIGYRILCASPYLRNAAEIVYAHQEHFDGTGYPRGLRGDQICLGARLFAVVDAYDAMRSRRIYREAWGPEQTVTEIRAQAGRQFDPTVVAAFLSGQQEIERLFLSLQSAEDGAPPQP